ncbi:cysteine peptidase C50 [Phanerochaete sordida]|uniref:separase n=1 Tax=Phanerochaete sordida TaxID=48140 RepID=A0A9P3LEY3_9APHY|nr:cysteine peptidase C50 [Phanerochaete sordida]
MPPRKPTTSREAPLATTAAAPRPTARTRTTRTATLQTEELTAKFETKLTISDPKGKQKAAEATTSKTTTTRTVVRKTRAAKDAEGSAEVAGLAKDFAKGLTLGSRQPEKTREERCTEAMQQVNSASRGLSALVESGWKSSAVPPKAPQRTASSKQQDPAATAAQHATAATVALLELRELKPGDMDIERAASSLVGKLVALELYDAALDALSQGRGPLLNLYSSSEENLEKTNEQLLSLPLPVAPVDDDILLTLISNYLFHSLYAFSYSTFGTSNAQPPPPLTTIADTITASSTLLHWVPLLKNLPAKHMDSILTRAYTGITKSSAQTACSTSSGAKALYTIRVYALQLLLHTSPTVLRPTTFWDQALKFAVAYVKDVISSAASAETKADATQAVLAAFATLEEVVLATRSEEETRKSWLSGTGFVGFCEYWMDFARRAGDTALVRRVAAYIRKPSPAPSSAGSPQDATPTADAKRTSTPERSSQASPPKTPLSTKQEAVRLSALLTEATSVVEQLKGEVDSDAQQCLADAASAIASADVFLVTVYAPRNAPDSDEHRYADKVRRAVERLRRAAVKALDALPEASRTARRLVQNIVLSVMDVVEATVYSTKSCDGDLLTAALDSLFALGRVTLVTSQPLTYSQVYDHLSRATTLLSRAEEYQCDKMQLANYLRCLSGAFHNIGGILYQATQHSHAARFLMQSCSLGEKALSIYRSAGPAEAEKQEPWNQLEDQMYRRWEILGVCHSKTDDRKQAFEAFVRCVKAFPFAKQTFLDTASARNVSALFESSPSLKQVAQIIDRLTYTGICDLWLEPQAVSLKSHLIDCFVPEGLSLGHTATRKVIIGAILERQVESLDSCRWKPAGRKAIRFLLEQALRIYDAKEMPIRRARVILKQLEHLHSCSTPDTPAAPDPEALGNEADALLSRPDVGLDAGLAHFRTRSRAILKLRLALLCHRAAQTSQFSRVVAYAEEACSILKGALSATAPPKPRQSVTPAQSPKVARTRAGARTGKAAPASRVPAARATRTRTAKTAAVVPSTPKKKRVQARVSVAPAAAVRTPEVGQGPPLVDDLPVLLSLLRSCSHLLGLLGQVVTKVHLLIVARRICEKFVDVRPDDYVSVSSDLAQEYINLGKLAKAGNVLHSAINLSKRVRLSDETQVLLHLRYAECHAAAGNVLKSSSAYCEAYGSSEMLPDVEKGMSVAQRLVLRTTILERAAVAASTFALIQYSRDDPAAAIDGMLQALRLWNRAVETLAKVVPPEPTQTVESDSDNPFLEKPSGGNTKTPPKPNEKPSSPKKVMPRLPALDGIEWRVAHGLLVTLFALAQAYLARGSPREAEYFAQQAKDVADSLDTPAMVGRALARIGEIYLHLHQVEDSHASLTKAAELAADTAGPDVAEIGRLRAEHSRRHSDGKHAQQLYDEAMNMLEELDSVFAALDGQAASPRKSLEGMLTPRSPKLANSHETLAPSVLMSILRQNIRLLHGEGEEYDTLLERFRNLSSTAEGKAEESALLAKLSLENVYTKFQADMFLSSLSESTITLPMGMIRDKASPASGSQDVLAILNNAERLFWADLGLISRRGVVFDVRDAAISLALVRAFQTSLGGSSVDSPVVAARLLDMSATITLQREVLEVIQHKYPDIATPDDLQWPVMTPNGSVMPAPKRKPKARFVSFGSDDEDGEDQGSSRDALKKFWDTVGAKYRNQVIDSTSLAAPRLASLPQHWTVVSISVTEDCNTMFVTRQRPGREPLIFCIPLKERRETVDEDETFLTFDDAIGELKEIIHLSDEGTRQAQHVIKDRAAISQWWADRAALDERMKDLLNNIEFCWLGAFKTILNDPTDIPEELLGPFRAQIELAFKRGLRLQDKKDKKDKTKLRLNDALLECFASLSPKCRDEELADLVYFILDLYQFHGMPVAVNEVDIDEVVIDLRSALEEHHARCIGKLRPQKDPHMFLVLDKNVAGIPWESLPVLRGRSVSRIPNVDFLLDRLEYCQQMGVGGSSAAKGPIDRIVVDPRNTFYVLNPSGDLKNTEGRFIGWLKDMKSAGWEGIVGRVPSELQFANALTRKDLVIYFGHGGAEQYIRSHKLRHLPRCAATMLWGCSSGALKEMGDFDRIGTPYNYMLSGCPTLVANLWDVTDRDIDKFSQAVFDKMHLTQDRVAKWTPKKHAEDATSIVAAVAQSRDVCKLKYLTGAAPVVYGIPFYL